MERLKVLRTGYKEWAILDTSYSSKTMPAGRLWAGPFRDKARADELLQKVTGR